MARKFFILHFGVFQAEEQTYNRYINVAYITLTVAPSNLYSPELSTNSGAFVGYILENSVNMTQVKTTPALGIPLRFVVSDRDLVSWFMDLSFMFFIKTFLLLDSMKFPVTLKFF